MTPGDSHTLVAPGVGFSLLFLPRGLPGGLLGGVLNQSNFEKSAISAFSLKQHMFIYARSEQSDLVSICTITNTQRIRIYPGKSKFILVKASLAPGQRKPNHIHVSYYWELIRTPLFTRVQIRRVFRYVQSWVNLFTWWYKRVKAYLGNLIFIHFFLRTNFYPNWSQSPYCV